MSVPKQKLGKVAKSGKLVENVTTKAGAISAQAVLAAKLAKTLGLPANGTVFTSAKKAKPAIIAKGGASALEGGYKVTLKLTKKARKKLAKLKRGEADAQDASPTRRGNRRLVTKSVTLEALRGSADRNWEAAAAKAAAHAASGRLGRVRAAPCRWRRPPRPENHPVAICPRQRRPR